MATVLPIAVIGLGNTAQSMYLPLIQRRWDLFDLVAVADHSTRRRRDVGGHYRVDEARRYESAEALYDAAVDKEFELGAVIVATTGVRGADVLPFIRRGIPVLLEPPVGLSEEDAADVVAFERMSGRSLVMISRPHAYDPVWKTVEDTIKVTDVRMIVADTVAPANGTLYRSANITSSAYDLTSEQRTKHRGAEKAALEEALGNQATPKDRDIYLKGLLTGALGQVGALAGLFGPLETVYDVRQWPKGVVPGTLALEGQLESGTHIQAAWHYLPFFPIERDRLTLYTSRRAVDIEFGSPYRIDERSRVTVTEREGSDATVFRTQHPGRSAGEHMLEVFHNAFTKGKEHVVLDARGGVREIALAQELMETIVQHDGRTLVPEPEPESESGQAQEIEPEAHAGTAVGAGPEPEDGTESEAHADPDAAPAPAPADGSAAESTGQPESAVPGAAEPDSDVRPAGEAPEADASVGEPGTVIDAADEGESTGGAADGQSPIAPSDAEPTGEPAPEADAAEAEASEAEDVDGESSIAPSEQEDGTAPAQPALFGRPALADEPRDA